MFLILTVFVVACGLRQSRSWKPAWGQPAATIPTNRGWTLMGLGTQAIRVHPRITILSPCRKPQKPLEPVTFHPSYFTLHISSLTFHPSHFILHISSLTFHPSHFILHISPFIFHPSPFILHISSLTYSCSEERSERYRSFLSFSETMTSFMGQSIPISGSDHNMPPSSPGW